MLGMLSGCVLGRELSHLCLSQCHRNAIDAYFYACPKTLCLQVVLRPQLSRALGDYRRVKDQALCGNMAALGGRHLLSSCKFSMRACFWLIEMPVFCFFRGLS